MKVDFDEKRKALDVLSKKILDEQTPTAKEWGGADVVITSRQPETSAGVSIPNKMHDLLRDPFPADAKHLAGYPGYRRIDSGEFRVCCKVNDKIIRVVVIR